MYSVPALRGQPNEFDINVTCFAQTLYESDVLLYWNFQRAKRFLSYIQAAILLYIVVEMHELHLLVEDAKCTNSRLISWISVMTLPKIKYNPAIHHRKSIRLKGYDYSSPGYYFVTICTQCRVCLFGEIVNGQMQLNDAGKMVDLQWKTLPDRFGNIRIDEYLVMPNHFHAILEIISPVSSVGALLVGAPLVGAPRGCPSHRCPKRCKC